MLKKTKNRGYNHPFFSTRCAPAVTEEELKPLFDDVKIGKQDARDRLIEGHMRLALSIAARYAFFGSDFEEVSAAALLGVCDAVNRIEKGQVVFDNITGYIIQYIHQHCATAVRMDNLIPMPRGKKPGVVMSLSDTDGNTNDNGINEVIDTLDTIIRTPEERAVVEARGQGLTDQETADLTGLERSKVTRIRHRLYKQYCEACNDYKEKQWT